MGGEGAGEGGTKGGWAWSESGGEDGASAEGGVGVTFGETGLVGDGDDVGIRVGQRNGIIRFEAKEVVEVTQALPAAVMIGKIRTRTAAARGGTSWMFGRNL